MNVLLKSPGKNVRRNRVSSVRFNFVRYVRKNRLLRRGMVFRKFSLKHLRRGTRRALRKLLGKSPRILSWIKRNVLLRMFLLVLLWNWMPRRFFFWMLLLRVLMLRRKLMLLNRLSGKVRRQNRTLLPMNLPIRRGTLRRVPRNWKCVKLLLVMLKRLRLLSLIRVAW